MCAQMNRFFINVFNYSASNKINFIKIILFMRKASAWQDYLCWIFFFFFATSKMSKVSELIYSLAICLLLTYVVLTYINAFVNAWFFSTLKRLDFNTLSSVCLAASGHRSNELKFHLCCLFKLKKYFNGHNCFLDILVWKNTVNHVWQFVLVSDLR